MDPTAEGKRLLRRVVDEILNGNDDEAAHAAADAIFAVDFVNHSAAPGRASDAAALKKHVAWLHKAFGDLRVTLEDVFGEGDRVVGRMRLEGTHQAPFAGVAPTGKRIAWTTISIVRVKDGRIAERWNVSDGLEIVRLLKES